jgi:hypothetical protein
MALVDGNATNIHPTRTVAATAGTTRASANTVSAVPVDRAVAVNT